MRLLRILSGLVGLVLVGGFCALCLSPTFVQIDLQRRCLRAMHDARPLAERVHAAQRAHHEKHGVYAPLERLGVAVPPDAGLRVVLAVVDGGYAGVVERRDGEDDRAFVVEIEDGDGGVREADCVYD